MWRGLGLVAVSWGVGALALRLTVASPEVCPAVTEEAAVEAAIAAAAWIERQQHDDGSYLYEYNIEADAAVPGYNSVRHAGVTMSLYQLAAEGYNDGLATADRGTEWMIRYLIHHDDWSALRDPNDGGIESGGNALMLAALEQRRLATGDPVHDDLMRRLARFLLVLQQADGSFLLAWDITTEAPVPGIRSKYATGEAFWALTLMHRIFPGEGWDAHARLTADYLANDRDRVEKQKFPPWADQWAAYGFAEMATWGLDEDHIRYVRTLAERFGFLVRVESRRTDGWLSKALHGRRARAAGMGTWSEALDSLWRLASAEPRLADMKEKLAERAVCAAGMLVERQVDRQEARGFLSPDIAEGAWFTEDLTRMDDQQHALSGLIRAKTIIGLRARRN
jgi:hypothetical protein